MMEKNNYSERADIAINLKGINTLKRNVERAIEDDVLTELASYAYFDWKDDRGNTYWCECQWTDLRDESIDIKDRRCEFTLTLETNGANIVFLVTTKLKKMENITDEEIYYEEMEDFTIDDIEIFDIDVNLG